MAQKAIALAHLAQQGPCSSERARERRTHVGYYLVDDGQAALKREIGYRSSLAARVRDVVLKWPDFFYFLGIELITFGIIALLISVLHVKPRVSLLWRFLFFLRWNVQWQRSTC